MKFCRIQELIIEGEELEGRCDTEGFPGPWLREVVESKQFKEAVAILVRARKRIGGYLNENLESWSFHVNCVISVDIPTRTSKNYENTLSAALEDAVDWEFDQPNSPITIPVEEIVDNIYRKLLYRAIQTKESIKQDKIFKNFNSKILVRARAYWKVLTDLEPDLFPLREISREINILKSELIKLKNDTNYSIRDELLISLIKSNVDQKNAILDWIERFKELQDEMDKVIRKIAHEEYMKMVDS